MTSPMVRVKIARRIEWPWTGTPTYSCHPWAGTIALDPTPGYGHDADLVRGVLARVTKAWPAEGKVTYHLATMEGTDRANGQTTAQYAKGGAVAAHHVFLSGKRIPPHPSVTRYLVAHEYGHCVEDWIWKRRGVTEDALREEYRKLRGLSRVSAGAGTWHAATGEVIACDFRYLVADVATDYWPHPGIARPERCCAAVRWWDEAVAERKAIGVTR